MANQEIAQEKSATRRLVLGKVLSDKMQKTVTVLVERKVVHPLYQKVLVRSKKYHAHVPDHMQIAVGDWVEILEVPPISKTKAWLVNRVVKSA